MKIDLKYHSTDNGNCRVYYHSKRGLLCCWQLVRPGEFELLSCSRDGEPECPIRSDAIITTPPPPLTDAIDHELIAFLAETAP